MKSKYYFGTKYLLSVVPNPDSSYGTTTGSGRYKKGTQVQISASPNTGYKFLQWREGETDTNPRIVTVNQDATFNALFTRIPTRDLRIVDEDLNLYTYNEYDALSVKPVTIGVAIKDGNYWLIYHNNYINGSAGYQLASAGSDGLDPLIFEPQSASNLLYPHSGLETSNVYKINYPSNNYASYYASTITDGKLLWYVPNLYETCYIFECVYDSISGAHDGFNSCFELIYGDSSHNIINSTPTSKQHAHWTSDVGFGGGTTSGKILPYRVFLNNGQYVYRSSGDYTFPNDDNYTRPVARIAIQTILYLKDGSTVTIPDNQLTRSLVSSRYKNNLIMCEVGINVTDIADHTFEDCSLLETIILPPKTITSIGGNAFDDCHALQSIIIPNSVTTFGSYTFYNCQNLTDITIPNSITGISYGMFYGCSKLNSISIPNSVTSIGDNAFFDCRGLTSVTIPNSVTSIGRSAFAGCSSLTSVTIPNSVTSIRSGAFSSCIGLTSVAIGNSVTSIGDGAFVSCTGLTSVTIEAETPPTLGANTLNNTNNCPIYVPSGAVSAYQAASGWSAYSSRIQAIPT